jgi:DNA-directed RNA polymerase specialized sigma24 family protein
LTVSRWGLIIARSLLIRGLFGDIPPMSSEESVSQWLDQIQAGDSAAAQKILERYFHRLVALARTKLQNTPRRAADEEDVALSVLDSFCRGAEQGRFPDLANRDNLWRLLVTITARKAYQLGLHEGSRRPRGRAVLDQAALGARSDSGSGLPGLESLADQQPTPALAAQFAEDCERLLAGLPRADLRAVALGKMEGYTNEEVAVQLGCGLRSVERKLKVIRSLWSQGDPPH